MADNNNRSSESPEGWLSKSSHSTTWTIETSDTLWIQQSTQSTIESITSILLVEGFSMLSTTEMLEKESRSVSLEAGSSTVVSWEPPSKETMSTSLTATPCATSRLSLATTKSFLLASTLTFDAITKSLQSASSTFSVVPAWPLTAESASLSGTRGQVPYQPGASTLTTLVTTPSIRSHPSNGNFQASISIHTDSDTSYPSQYLSMTATSPESRTITTSRTHGSSHTETPSSILNSGERSSSNLPTSAKIALGVALPFFVIILTLLAIIYLRRCRHSSLPTIRYQTITSPSPQLSSVPSSTVMVHHRSTDSEPLIISIDAGEAKTSMDSSGVRWPESVVLTGDAKAFREATISYEREWREGLRRSEEMRGWDTWGGQF